MITVLPKNVGKGVDSTSYHKLVIGSYYHSLKKYLYVLFWDRPTIYHHFMVIKWNCIHNIRHYTKTLT